MATPQFGPETSLEIRRTIAAPPDKAFDAWTKPEKMKQWFCRGMEEATVDMREVDLRVGGRLRAEVDAKGRRYRLRGEYREVKPPDRLVFTWAWEDEPDASQTGETLVTVEFRRLGQSNFTEITLRHEGFATVAACNDHRQGWNACFDMLEKTRTCQ